MSFGRFGLARARSASRGLSLLRKVPVPVLAVLKKCIPFKKATDRPPNNRHFLWHFLWQSVEEEEKKNYLERRTSTRSQPIPLTTSTTPTTTTTTMATKRPAHDVHPSRQTQVPRDSNPRKRQKPDNLSGSKSFKKARPVNELKTSIRNIKRLLERDVAEKTLGDSTGAKNKPLPPKVRISKERELASAQHELAESQAAEKRSKMIARYHKVRFFDRQKATKRLKRARKAMKEVEDDAGRREELAREADECELDVQYAMYYPLDVPYVALYPSAKKVEGQEEDGKVVEVARQGDAGMRALLKKCVEEGKLDALRNGRLDKEGNYKVVEQAVDDEMKAKDMKKNKVEGKEDKKGKRKAEEMEPEASDNESDGGFFE